MAILRGLTDRTLAVLIGVAFLLLAVAGGALAWAHHTSATRTAREQHAIDSLTTVASGALRRADSLAGAFAAAQREVVRTDTVYRTARRIIDTVRIVTARGDTIAPDTLPPVRALRLACDATIAARDTAIAACAARFEALTQFVAADTSRRVLARLADERAWRARASSAGRRGFKRGTIAGVALAVAGAFALRQLAR